MHQVGLFEAKTKLSSLLRRVKRGESFTITVRNEPVAELRPLTRPKVELVAGSGRNPAFSMAKDFNRPVADFRLDDE